MSAEIETTEAPNWLKDLEAKRERRVKAKLGHEAGAGAPCLKCDEKCPGLDLHFWRKICKSCKCSKEDHDVPEEDVYGWAEFQLLGNKPNRIKTKIVLPGRKDEVELEWTPQGKKETVDKFLKTLPPEVLPVKGSEAAQQEKQLLQKQIPLHDLDPTLCHDLTEKELKQMQDYIADMKENWVGVGQIVQIGGFDSMIRSDKLQKDVTNSQIISHNGQYISGNLSRKLSDMNVRNQNLMPTDQYNVTEQDQDPYNSSIRSINYPMHSNNTTQQSGMSPSNLHQHPPLTGEFEQNNMQLASNVQGIHKNPSEVILEPYKGGIIRDLNYPLGGPNQMRPLPNFKNLEGRTVLEDPQNPDSIKFKNMHPGLFENVINANEAEEALGKLQNSALPHYAAAGKHTLYNDTQNPSRIGNFKDLAFSTYDPLKLGASNEDNFNNLTAENNKQELERQLQQLQANRLELQENNPLRYILKTQYGDYNQNKFDELQLGPSSNTNVKVNTRSLLPQYNPKGSNISEDNVNPSSVYVGPINDICYENPEIKQANYEQNPFGQSYYNPPQFTPMIPGDNSKANVCCHRCKIPFKETEFGIQIEQNNLLYHPDCFKCIGCNQSLAKMLYVYDKDSDDIYCCRDYAKIRGMQRCNACDELIFTKEYCLAENKTFHIKHFCCYECDKPLAGENYVMEEMQPLCLPCFDSLKANKCKGCGNVIKPDEQGANLKGVHFHATDECFACKVCKRPLLGAKLMFKNETLYCSPDCYSADQ